MSEIKLELSENFKDLPFEEKQEQILIFFRDVGKVLHEAYGFTNGEYIHAMLMGAGLFIGFCIKDEQDAKPIKLEVVCPAIMREVLKTLGENVAEGLLQKQARLQFLKDTPPSGRG